MSEQFLFEICVASAEDAKVVEAGGADRIELNSALSLGGLTPSLGALIEIRQTVSLPVIAMVRPRAGGFGYSEPEFHVMQRDVDLMFDHGADGIAFGILDHAGEIDMARCREILRQIVSHRSDRIQGAVFHRAFDFTPRPLEAIERLIDLGVRRVMTSGQRAAAIEGAALIRELVERANGRIEILPAGGIRPHNVAELLARTGCTQIHASLREPRVDPSVGARPNLSLAGAQSTADSGRYDMTSPDNLAALLAALRRPATSPQRRV